LEEEEVGIMSATTGGSGGGGAAYAAGLPWSSRNYLTRETLEVMVLLAVRAGGGGGAGTLGGTGTRAGGSGSYIASFAAIGGSPAGWFAGGGAGMVSSNVDSGIGGIGGGGNAGRSGSANTGGGGGATFSAASIGGSGIVAIRYSGTPIALGGEITQSEGYTYHVYRTVGTSSFTIF
jgi:hypothetical protein